MSGRDSGHHLASEVENVIDPSKLENMWSCATVAPWTTRATSARPTAEPPEVR